MAMTVSGCDINPQSPARRTAFIFAADDGTPVTVAPERVTTVTFDSYSTVVDVEAAQRAPATSTVTAG